MSEFQPSRFVELTQECLANQSLTTQRLTEILRESGGNASAQLIHDATTVLFGQIQEDTATGAEIEGGLWNAAERYRVMLLDHPTSMSTDASHQAKRQIGDYSLIEPLGRGGMGEVWLAKKNQNDEEPLVVKFLPPELRGNIIEIQRLKKCFEHVSKLCHENICPVVELGEDDEIGLFLVMHYARGVTLSQYRGLHGDEELRLPLDDVIRILRPVAQALDHSHSLQVVHLDVKPANIMVDTESDAIQLVDFGLAEEIRQSMTNLTVSSQSAAGTWIFMAPERWRGQRATAKSDQFSLGVVAYELLAGHPPFSSNDPAVLRMCVLGDPIPAIPGLETRNLVVAKSLAQDPETRFETCKDFIDALESPEQYAKGGDHVVPASVDGVAGGRFATFIQSRSFVVVAASILGLVLLFASRQSSVRQWLNLDSENSSRTSQAASVPGASVENEVPVADTENASVPVAVSVDASEQAPATPESLTEPDTLPSPNKDAIEAELQRKMELAQQERAEQEMQAKEREKLIRELSDAKTEAASERRKALVAGARAHAPEKLAEIDDLDAKAEQSANDGDIDTATAIHRQAAEDYRELAMTAEDLETFADAKQKFETLVTTFDQKALAEDGDPPWSAIESRIRSAESLPPPQATAVYQECHQQLRDAHSDIHLRSSQRLQKSGDNDKAVDMLRVVLREDPDHDKALSMLRKILSEDPSVYLAKAVSSFGNLDPQSRHEKAVCASLISQEYGAIGDQKNESTYRQLADDNMDGIDNPQAAVDIYLEIAELRGQNGDTRNVTRLIDQAVRLCTQITIDDVRANRFAKIAGTAWKFGYRSVWNQCMNKAREGTGIDKRKVSAKVNLWNYLQCYAMALSGRTRESLGLARTVKTNTGYNDLGGSALVRTAASAQETGDRQTLLTCQLASFANLITDSDEAYNPFNRYMLALSDAKDGIYPRAYIGAINLADPTYRDHILSELTVALIEKRFDFEHANEVYQLVRRPKLRATRAVYHARASSRPDELDVMLTDITGLPPESQIAGYLGLYRGLTKEISDRSNPLPKTTVEEGWKQLDQMVTAKNVDLAKHAVVQLAISQIVSIEFPEERLWHWVELLDRLGPSHRSYSECRNRFDRDVVLCWQAIADRRDLGKTYRGEYKFERGYREKGKEGSSITGIILPQLALLRTLADRGDRRSTEELALTIARSSEILSLDVHLDRAKTLSTRYFAAAVLFSTLNRVSNKSYDSIAKEIEGAYYNGLVAGLSGDVQQMLDFRSKKYSYYDQQQNTMIGELESLAATIRARSISNTDARRQLIREIAAKVFDLVNNGKASRRCYLRVGRAYGEIAVVTKEQQDYDKAIEYLAMADSVETPFFLGQTIGQLGIEFPDEAAKKMAELKLGFGLPLAIAGVTQGQWKNRSIKLSDLEASVKKQEHATERSGVLLGTVSYFYPK